VVHDLAEGPPAVHRPQEHRRGLVARVQLAVTEAQDHRVFAGPEGLMGHVVGQPEPRLFFWRHNAPRY